MPPARLPPIPCPRWAPLAPTARGGGFLNSISGQFATVPGGRQNIAAGYAFAAGRRAKALHQGAFVWADSSDFDFASTGLNQFLIRAGGGVGIGINNPQTLCFGKPDDVRRDLRAALEAHFEIIGPECAVPLNAPLSQLRALTDAFFEMVN